MNNRDKYEKAFIECFSVDNSQLNGELTYNSIPEWDSIGHMNLIATLEDEFEIQFETDDIIDFGSFMKGMEILSKYKVDVS